MARWHLHLIHKRNMPRHSVVWPITVRINYEIVFEVFAWNMKFSDIVYNNIVRNIMFKIKLFLPSKRVIKVDASHFITTFQLDVLSLNVRSFAIRYLWNFPLHFRRNCVNHLYFATFEQQYQFVWYFEGFEAFRDTFIKVAVE